MDERARLLHAIEAVDAIQRYTAEGREAFFADGKTQDAVIRNIEVLGTGSQGHIRRDTRSGARGPMAKIAGMRDVLIHEYFGVELKLVWDVVEDELPRLRLQLERLSKLAQRMGTSHSAISRIESGRYPTTVQTLCRLAKALDTHFVMGFADDVPSTPGADITASADLVAVG